MVKNATNDWALNSATGGLDSFMAYQSTNSGDTYVNASNATGVVRINYENGSGTGFKVYGGNRNTLYASFTGMAAIQFPGLAASSGHNCLQVDNSGYLSNTGAACGTGSANGTVNAGTSGQIAFYNGSGTVLSGTNAVSVSAGGTGASTASGALGNLGGAAITGAAFTGPVSTSSTLAAKNLASIGPRYDVTQFGAVGNGVTDDTAAIQAAFNGCYNGGVAPYGGVVEFPGPHSYVVSSTINAYDSCQIEGVVSSSSVAGSPVRILWNGAAAGTVSTITAFSVTSGVATFTAANSLTAGQWVDIEGLTTASGVQLNRNIARVSATGLSSTQFEIPVNNGNIALTSDNGTAAAVNVLLALDSNARYEQSISNVMFGLASSAASNSLQVNVYFGGRVDTGTHLINVQAAQATEYGYYFAYGGINASKTLFPQTHFAEERHPAFHLADVHLRERLHALARGLEADGAKSIAHAGLFDNLGNGVAELLPDILGQPGRAIGFDPAGEMHIGHAGLVEGRHVGNRRLAIRTCHRQPFDRAGLICSMTTGNTSMMVSIEPPSGIAERERTALVGNVHHADPGLFHEQLGGQPIQRADAGRAEAELVRVRLAVGDEFLHRIHRHLVVDDHGLCWICYLLLRSKPRNRGIVPR